jgi:hypothetical protein
MKWDEISRYKDMIRSLELELEWAKAKLKELEASPEPKLQ